jgi:nitrogen PTS system EIIA component
MNWAEERVDNELGRGEGGPEVTTVMPYRNMSVVDFARHVGMDPGQVAHLAERGKLPGHKVGGEWRFNRAQVTEWLQQEMHTFDEGRLQAIERAMGAPPPTDEEAASIVTDLIGIEGIDLALPANTKPSVLRELVKLAGKTGLLYDPDGLLDALEQREALCSTALPNGVAIPHPRQPMPYASAEPLVCVARSTRGIPFGSPYGGLSNLFFLICTHEDRHHLRVLARLMRILDAPTIQALLEVDNDEAFFKILADQEAAVVAQMRAEG